MNIIKSSASATGRRVWFAVNRGRFRDDGPPRRPRVLVDVSVIVRHDAQTGIQRVVRAIWSQLSQRKDAAYDFVPVYAGASHGYCIASDPPLDSFFFPGTPVAARTGDKFLGLDLTAHYLPHCTEQLSAWRAQGATVHAVLYDLLPLIRPEWFNDRTRSHFGRWFDTVAKHADQLLCISDDVAQQLRTRLGGMAGPSIGRLHLSGEIEGSKPSEGVSPEALRVLNKIQHTPTILMVGTIEPRKGYQAALAAFDRIWQERRDFAPNLLIVGKAGWKTHDIQAKLRDHPLVGHKLYWLDEVSDEALGLFYQASTGVLVASRGEGFGLPLMEAARRRRWVLARDLSVFREQNLTNVLYFDDDSSPALGKTVLDFAKMATRVRPEAQQLPTWADCVQRLLVDLGVSQGMGYGSQSQSGDTVA